MYINYAKYVLICYSFCRHPQGAINYTFLQTQSRHLQLPREIQELSEMLSYTQNANQAFTFQIPFSAFFNQKLIVNGVSVGIIYAKLSAIDRYRKESAAVEVGINGI